MYQSNSSTNGRSRGDGAVPTVPEINNIVGKTTLLSQLLHHQAPSSNTRLAAYYKVNNLYSLSLRSIWRHHLWEQHLIHSNEYAHAFLLLIVENLLHHN